MFSLSDLRALPAHRLPKRPIGRTERFANVMLIGGIVYCVAVLGHYLYLYEWSRERYFFSASGRILYEILPAALAGLLLLSLRLTPAAKVALTLCLLSTAMSICAAELVFWKLGGKPDLWFNSKPMWERKQIAKRFGVDFDTRTRLQVILDLRAKGVPAVPATVPMWLLQPQKDESLKSAIAIKGKEVLPLGGISHKRTVLCNEIGEFAIFDSDEHGFANPKDVWNSGAMQIAAVGDSFTQGYCVPASKSFVGLIRNSYAATLNLASGGNGPLLMLAALNEYAAYVRPVKSLWFYFEGNDLTDLEREKQSALLMHYLAGSFRQGLLAQQRDIDRSLAVFIDQAEIAAAERERQIELREAKFESAWQNELDAMLKLQHLRQRLGIVYGRLERPDLTSQVTEGTLNLLYRVLAAAKATVKGWNGNLYFVYLPAWERYGRPELAERHRDRVLAMAKTLGLPLLDMHRVFQSYGDPLALFPFRQPAHYNLEGERIVAGAVLRFIQSKGDD